MNGCNSRKGGEKLAKQYCSSCHIFPDPSLLDKTTWKNNVLPEMAFRMGLDNQKLFSVPYQDLNKVMQTLPARPMVTQEEWEAIAAYFLKNAPDSLLPPKKLPTDSITEFTVIGKSFPFYSSALVTNIQFDSVDRKIYMGDRHAMLYQFDSAFNVLAYTQLPSAPSHLSFSKNSITISLMGIMEPNDQERGAIVNLKDGSETPALLIDSVQRPVYFEKSDLNNNEEKDIIVCAFGNYTGELLAFEKRDGSFIKHIVSPMPGARKVIVKDVNGDGLNDILALMTQARERISLFINKGGFAFEEKLLLSFPPVYGSSYFEIADFNKDGNFDILYTNGDNADYSVKLKPYHGIKIFLNDGSLNFSESWSYPMYGASQAVARDFDQDGDLDIFAISFFPDFINYPLESIIYFDNKGDNAFKAKTTALANSGRWLTMEIGDIDFDSDDDVLVGAYDLMVPKEMKTYWKNQPTAILIFKNKLKMDN